MYLLPRFFLVLFSLILQINHQTLAYPALATSDSKLVTKGVQPWRIIPRPNNRQVRVCQRSTCDEDEDELDEVDSDEPAIIETDVISVEQPEYPKHCEGKIKKREKPDPPQKSLWTQCAGEYCPDRPLANYNKQPQDCTHMAKRKYLPKFWTCCPQGSYAAFNGHCCRALDGKNKYCKKGQKIPLSQY